MIGWQYESGGHRVSDVSRVAESVVQHTVKWAHATKHGNKRRQNQAKQVIESTHSTISPLEHIHCGSVSYYLMANLRIDKE